MMKVKKRGKPRNHKGDENKKDDDNKKVDYNKSHVTKWVSESSEHPRSSEEHVTPVHYQHFSCALWRKV
jgi:hypothetical protein